jgi:hypothetical protein
MSSLSFLLSFLFSYFKFLKIWSKQCFHVAAISLVPKFYVYTFSLSLLYSSRFHHCFSLNFKPCQARRNFHIMGTKRQKVWYARQRHERPRLWGRNLTNKETRMSTRNNVCHSLNLVPQLLTQNKRKKTKKTCFLSFTKLLSPKSGNPETKFWNCLMIDNHLSLSLTLSLCLPALFYK